MATRKIYRTTGVVPPSTTEMYQDADGNWYRDGGATWDASRKAWRRTLWKLTEPQYRVTYDDGQQEFSTVAPEVYVEPVAPVEPVEPIEPVNGEGSEVPVENGEMLNGGTSAEEEKPKERRVVKVDAVPATWELQNPYIASSERPEWDEYMTREIIGIEPIVAPLPQERENGGDWLAQRVKRVKGLQFSRGVSALR